MRWMVLLVSSLIGVSLPAADPKPVIVKFGKLSAEAPSEWKSEKPNSRLRSHQFKLASDDPSQVAAELAVNPESDPNPDKSFPRWKAMFIPPGGKAIDDIAKVKKETFGSVTLHLLDITGTWKYRERPFDPKSKEEIREGYRVIWAIVVTGDEATHVRLSGPATVVDKHQPSFERFLKSIK